MVRGDDRAERAMRLAELRERVDANARAARELQRRFAIYQELSRRPLWARVLSWWLGGP